MGWDMSSNDIWKSIRIREIRLSDKYKFRGFKCGNPTMDAYLKTQAYENHVYGDGSSQLVIYNNGDRERVIAYYTLKCDSIIFNADEPTMETKRKPCIEISRIAVVSDWQRGKKGINLGTHLIGYIIHYIQSEIAPKVGCKYITLYAVPEKIDWYSSFGFEKFDEEADEDSDENIYMFLEITNEEKINEYKEKLTG